MWCVVCVVVALGLELGFGLSVGVPAHAASSSWVATDVEQTPTVVATWVQTCHTGTASRLPDRAAHGWLNMSNFGRNAGSRPPRLPQGQVRMARLLWSVAHRDFDALQRDLQRARSEVMGPFSGGAAAPCGPLAALLCRPALYAVWHLAREPCALWYGPACNQRVHVRAAPLPPWPCLPPLLPRWAPPAAAAMESYSRAYPYLVKLHMLQEIADVAGEQRWLLTVLVRRSAPPSRVLNNPPATVPAHLAQRAPASSAGDHTPSARVLL